MNVPLMYQYIPFLPPIHLILKAGYKFTLAGKNINIYAYIYIIYIYVCVEVSKVMEVSPDHPFIDGIFHEVNHFNRIGHEINHPANGAAPF